MTAQHKLRAFTLPATALLAIVVAVGFTSHAMAFCSSCGVQPAMYSAGYAAPVAYTAAYAPTYTTAYAPPVAYTTAYAPAYTTTNSGWYPGRFVGRVNRAIWGYPTTTYYAPTYTAAYAPTYTAAYAPTYTAAYAPAYTTAYAAPACSTCSASYAPACSTCSASYAPACSSCSTCETYAAAAPACATCSASTIAPASYTDTVAVPAESTYSAPSGTSTGGSLEPTPALPPDANVPATRGQQEVQKPAPADPPLPLPTDTEADSTDDSATNLQPPKLFDPNDRTASRHAAPVWTAVYHKVSGAESTAQPVSLQQVERDAEGWTSASK